MPQMSVRVEEFYNRVHSPRDGRFATSGTGGGHYRGRAAGKKRPTPGNGLPLHIKDARSTVNKAFDALEKKKSAGPSSGSDARHEAAVKDMAKRVEAYQTRKYNIDVLKSSHGHAKERRWRPGEADKAPHKKMSVDSSTSGTPGKFKWSQTGSQTMGGGGRRKGSRKKPTGQTTIQKPAHTSTSGGRPGVTPSRAIRGQSSTVRTGHGVATHKRSTAYSGHATAKPTGRMGQENNSSRFYTNRRKATVKAKNTAKVPGRDSVLLAWSKKLRKNKNI